MKTQQTELPKCLLIGGVLTGLAVGVAVLAEINRNKRRQADSVLRCCERSLDRLQQACATFAA